MMADEIIVLGKDEEDKAMGIILERGTHAQLIKDGGVYADMWEAQTSVEREMLAHIESGDVKSSDS